MIRRMRRAWLFAALVAACTPAPKVAPRVGDLYRAPNGRCQVRLATPSAWGALDEGEDSGIPADVDCPDELLDPHEVSGAPARPKGREGWLRVKPSLFLISNQVCTYEPDRFCRPPGDAFTCEAPRPSVAVDCDALDGTPLLKPTRWSVSAFRYTDAAGRCRLAAARECTQVSCEHLEGDVTACP
jgi:hypothetical protein